MKKLTIFISFLSLSTLLLFVNKPVLASSPQAVFYVSPSGNDQNPGTLERPFKTLEKVRNVIRTVNNNMTGDIIVYLRGGTYTLTSPLVFDQNDSGTNGFNIVYQNYQKEIPVISGGKQITGWEQDGNKWKANVGSTMQTRQMYVNGQRAIRARSVAGLDEVQIFYNESGIPAGYITSKATSMQNWQNISDIELAFNAHWMHHRCSVQEISQTTILMDQPCFRQIQARVPTTPVYPAWIENAYELLDTQGEWYYNQTTGWIYYIPRDGENVTTARVIVPTIETLIKGEGTLDRPIQNIQFHGITFSYNTWLEPGVNGLVEFGANFLLNPNGNSLQHRKPPAAVSFQTARRVKLERNVFAHLGSGGLDFGASSQNNTITGNHFYDISSNGVQIGDVDKPLPTDARELAKGNTISNNYIHNVANEYRGGVGIWLGHVQESVVSHNELHDLPYSGIFIGRDLPTYEPPFTLIRDNSIVNNLVYDYTKELEDGGGIYFLSPQPGTNVAGNVIRDQVRSSGPGTIGNIGGALYLDIRSRYITAFNNAVYDNSRNVLLNETGDNYLHDNWWQNRYPTDILNNQMPTFGLNRLENNRMIVNKSEIPSHILADAGLEAAYEDIKKPIPTPSPLPGDIDGNSKVDIFDYNLLVQNFGRSGAVGFTPADIDNNGRVDIFDYNILVGNFGK